MVYEAKEPASITAVSIPTIAREKFVDSKFWHKAENLLFVFYEYESGTAVPAAKYANFHIKGYSFHQFIIGEETLSNSHKSKSTKQ